MAEVAKARNENLSRDLARRIFQLSYKHDWISNREDQINCLLKLCENNEEKDIVCHFLAEFEYVNGRKAGLLITQMANYISKDTGWSPEEAQIVAMTFDHDEADSGQLILQMLKPKLGGIGWSKAKQCNFVGRFSKEVAERPKIVLIDEFSGTGKTVLNRVNYIKKNANGNPVEIHVVLMAAMRNAVEVLEAAGVRVGVMLTCEPGISTIACNEKRNRWTELVKRIESEFLSEINGNPLPSLGYGEAEALYSLENGNTPNSVFPMFWWKYLKSGADFLPAFERQDAKYEM